MIAFGLLALVLFAFSPCSSDLNKTQLKEQVAEMFYFAYNSYMNNAWPADELMPLSCKGRFRGVTQSRGDVDDALGNYTLTLIDTLDTLVVLGDFEGFEEAVNLVLDYVDFDQNVVVSVFEANIRVVGGCLSAHVMAMEIKERLGLMPWYKSQLLDLAVSLADRLLPAFNTTTGLPHPRINLKYGLTPLLKYQTDTCTACGGSIILEFTALSRLTGNPIYEMAAKKAMDYLWTARHRDSDLMGSVLNIHSGDWIRRDSGVGAGIDSYYEYCFKAYILLGDESYLHRFNKHYEGVMRYVSQGHLLVDVHMHKPEVSTRGFMDALLAFWPGLQVLKGDLKAAIETHEMLYHVVKKHSFLPEAFTHDFKVHWCQHHLRPEFVESTYFLYKATKDPHYLEVGKEVIESLNKHTRVPCGFASIKDIRTMTHEDRMDSFVLSETFKYLYLLFAEEDSLFVHPDEYVFTTEAHFIPLNLTRSDGEDISLEDVIDSERKGRYPWHQPSDCPNAKNNVAIDANQLREAVRAQIVPHSPRQDTGTANDAKRVIKPRLKASLFSANNLEHVGKLREMGIEVVDMGQGKLQLVQSLTSAMSDEAAAEGILFMNEMMELAKLTEVQNQPDRVVQIMSSPFFGQMDFVAFPAQFGDSLDLDYTKELVVAKPFDACLKLSNWKEIKDRIVLVERGNCMFIEKARVIQRLGGAGIIVLDNIAGTSSSISPSFAMSGDGSVDIRIPSVFLFHSEGVWLRELTKLYQFPVVRLARASANPQTFVPTFLEYAQAFKFRGEQQDKSKNVVKEAAASNSVPSFNPNSNSLHFAQVVPEAQELPNARMTESGPVIDFSVTSGGERHLRFRFDRFLDWPTIDHPRDLPLEQQKKYFHQLLGKLYEQTNLAHLNGYDKYFTVIEKLLLKSFGQGTKFDKIDEFLLNELAGRDRFGSDANVVEWIAQDLLVA